MADRYFAVSLVGGDLATDVAEGAAATPGAFADLRVTYDATGANKAEVVKALMALEAYILQDTFPPV